jgi:hypothetical protein
LIAIFVRDASHRTAARKINTLEKPTAAAQPGRPRKAMVRPTCAYQFLIAIFVRDANHRAAARNVNIVESVFASVSIASQNKQTEVCVTGYGHIPAG